MRERGEMRTAALQVSAVEGRAVQRLKSWLPEHTGGGNPVMLAGQALPSEVGVTLRAPMRVLCTGPGDWLIMSSAIPPDLSEQGLVLVDLSDGLAAVEVSGPAAREVLSKGCGLDLHPRSFPAGQCARTRFAQIPVVIECLDETPRFELHVVRSYLQYLRSWLTDASIEFGDF